jgi:Zn finger protein HypA/HybF involved in hydrogenase expression
MPNHKPRKLHCNQCGHEWWPRTDDVRQCPKRSCHSLKWDKPKSPKKEETR